jgi:hypothetical protein
MFTQILPRDQWLHLLDGLDQQHEKWFVSVELHCPEINGGEDILELPLQKIVAQLNGHPDDFISIAFGPADSEQIRKLPAPSRVRLGWTQKGSQQALAIESEEGLTLLARFRQAPIAEPPQAGIRLNWDSPV